MKQYVEAINNYHKKMEKEKQAKPVPTSEDRLLIIAHSFGQKCEIDLGEYPVIKTGEIESVDSSDKTVWVKCYQDFHHYGHPEQVVLLKKPLGRISEADRECLQNITGLHHWINIKTFLDNIIGQESPFGKTLPTISETQQAIDFLRERGYALPYKNWSVKELVEFGIYKLID